MTHLFLLTIGPVQSFIAQARKAHDLYAGSRMLSELCRAGIKQAKVQWGNDCIISPNANAASIPNRFWAKITTNDTTGIMEDKGEAVENAVKAEWSKFADNALGKLERPEGFDRQIADQLDIQWLFVPVENGDYNSAFSTMNDQLAGIKNLRPFGQLPEKGRKCIVDGERNVKFYRKNREESGKPAHEKLFQEANEVTVQEYDDGSLAYKHLQPGEGLSAVSFAKRKYLSSGTEFDSTAKIALYDLLFSPVNGKKLEDDEVLKSYQQFFTDHFDEQLLYEDNLTVKYFDKHGLFPKLVKGKTEQEAKELLAPKVNEAAKMLQSIKDKVKTEYDDKPFTKYYALIKFDGDKMGKWLSGDKGFLKPGSTGKLNLEQFHQDFTKAVSNFAKTVEEQLEKPKGRTVFAGGEDFLGFINLHHLFPVMHWLRELFKDKVNGALRENTSDYSIAEGAELNMSAGVVIAHYKEPLSEVLKAANEVEKQAKESGRNCFVIRAMRHAGGDTTCQLSWYLDNDQSSTHVLSRIMKELESEKPDEGFSSNFIAQTMKSMKAMQFEPPRTLMAKELSRTLVRSCKLQKKPSESADAFWDRKKQAIDYMWQNLRMLLENIAPGEFDEVLPAPKKPDYVNMTSLLSIFDFITRKTR
jgi:CRISPR-associated protein Cmr2